MKTMKTVKTVNVKKIVMLVTLVLMTTSVMLSSVSAIPTVSTNVQVWNNTSNQNEPMVAINPSDHNKLVVGYNDYSTGVPRASWSWSDNGGTSWTFGGTHTLTGYSREGDPVVAFDSTGTAYFAGLAWNHYTNPTRDVDGSIFLAKSNDGGHTFTVAGFPKIVAAGSGTSNYLDKPWLFINPANNDIYIAWTKRVNAFATPSGGETSTIWFTRSQDGGGTFSSPVQVGSDLNTVTYPMSHGAQITATSGSNVYVSWHTTELGTLDANNDGVVDAGWQPPKIWISQSTDGGASFGPSNLVATKQYSYPAIFISMGADPSNGRIYITYADRPSYPGDLDIYVSTSTSATGPWTRIRVNDVTTRSQFWPSLSVAPNGRAELIWYDYRDSASQFNIYYTASTDGGATWEANTKVTDQLVTPTGLFAGDYITIASVNEKAQAVWMDNRNGNPDIYTATLTMPTLPPTYDATIDAYCNTEAATVSVDITIDGGPSGFSTPHTFTGLTGTHTFTVPATDANVHPFKQWSTGSPSTTITVSAAGTYKAYYEFLQVNVIPEVPFGTIMTFLSMFIALVGFVGFKRFRPKYRPQ